MTSAVKVGSLVVVFAVLLFAAYAFLGRNLFGPKPVTYYATFDNATGITVGTRVLLAGVKVGQVGDIQLKSPTEALVTLLLGPEVELPEGTRAVIPGSLLSFGESAILLVAPERYAANLTPGAVLPGERQKPMDAFLPDADDTLRELNLTLAAARELMQDKDLKEGVTELLATSTATLKQFELVAMRVDGLLLDNRAIVSQAMRSAADTMEEIHRGTRMVTELIGDPIWRDEAQALLAQLNSTGKQAESLIASLNEFVNDPELREPLRRTMENVDLITESGTRIASNTEEMTRNGIVISEKAIELADRANEIAAEAKTVVRRIQDFFERVPTGVSLQPTYEMDLLRDTGTNRWRTDVGVQIPTGEGVVHLGVFDAFESNKLTLQLARPFSASAEYRYGIYASKPGVGVDYRVAPRASLRGDLFDINNPRLDLRFRYDFNREYVGWLGVNRIFNDNAITLGIGVRR